MEMMTKESLQKNVDVSIWNKVLVAEFLTSCAEVHLYDVAHPNFSENILILLSMLMFPEYGEQGRIQLIMLLMFFSRTHNFSMFRRNIETMII